MRAEMKPGPSAAGLRIGMAVSRYHERITTALREAAERAFLDAGGSRQDLHVEPAPGAFELTAVCRALAARGDLDAVVAVGCIIAGETRHDRYLAAAVAHGLTGITVQTGVPVCFGVLTCDSLAQARARAGGAKGNKGAEAMAAAIETALTVRGLRAVASR